MRSFRWLTSEDIDVDAYLLSDTSWMLFAYVKNPSLAASEEHLNQLALRFARGKVSFVAGALKTEKGSEPLKTVSFSDEVPAEVWCKDGWIRYRLETAEVLNPGLFLDQTHNRDRLIERIQAAYERKTLRETDALLNLFSYTGSFTIASVCAGLKNTTSVDASSRYLEWEKLNFDANFGGLAVEHRLIRDDARDFLRREIKRGNRYRWIVIDPPTFSRGDKKIFKVQDDMPELMENAFQCLLPGGAILVSTNDSRWETRAFNVMVTKFAREKELEIEWGRTPSEFGAAHPLKSVWLLSVESTA